MPTTNFPRFWETNAFVPFLKHYHEQNPNLTVQGLLYMVEKPWKWRAEFEAWKKEDDLGGAR